MGNEMEVRQSRTCLLNGKEPDLAGVTRHRRVTSNEGRKSGPESEGLLFEPFGRWQPQKVSEQGTGWSRAPRTNYVTTCPLAISESSSSYERCREKDNSVFIQKKCFLFEG